MTAAELDPLRSWLQSTTGLEADLLGRQSLERAVRKRLADTDGLTSADYQRLLMQDPAEQQMLIEALVVGESWFLREPRSFSQLVDMARRQSQRPLRLLSCGCAGGEEPYSLVMALLEAGLSPQQLEVEAIDISAVALARAAEGSYGSHALRGMELRRLQRFFDPDGQRWRLRPEFRGMVRFHHGSLQQRLQELPGGWQAVLCRNVMLYMNDEARQDLLRVIAGRLAPDGLLLVAAAESALVPSAIYRRLDGGHGAGFIRRDGPPEPAPATISTPRQPRRSVPRLAPPLEPDTHLMAARQLKQLGQLEEALVALRRCLYLDPRHREALILRAELSSALGRHEAAEQMRRRLERSSRQNP